MQIKLHNHFNLPAQDWNNLLAQSVTHVPFLRHEYLSVWWQTLGGGEWAKHNPQLWLLSAWQNEELVGIAPLFYAKEQVWLLGSVEISDYLDLIVRPEHLQPFIAALLQWLQTSAPQPWSALNWVNLPQASPTLPALQAESALRGLRYTQSIYQPTPSIPLPGDFEQYLAGIDKKQRHEIRRKIRRAEESGRALRWYILQDESELDEGVDCFLHLMAHDEEKAAFLTDVMRTQMKASLHAAFRAGWLQLAFIEIDGQKAAGYLNFDYDNKIWVYNSGLNPHYRELSPGWVLLGYLLRWANENKREEFDFMRGDEDYKFKFGGNQNNVLRVSVEK